MLKLTRWFIWGLFSLLLLTALDQVLLRVDLPVPGYTQVREFYIDFRSRLIGLVEKDPGTRVITTNKSGRVDKGKKTISTKVKQAQQRYLYVDAEGALQFADSLDLVPLQYRRDAQPLSE